MKKTRIKNKQSTIFEAFKSLGYKFVNTYSDVFRLYTPDDKELDLEFTFSKGKLYRIEQEFPNFTGSICFFQKGIFLEWLGDKTITILARGNREVFINIHNFDREIMGVSKGASSEEKDITPIEPIEQGGKKE